jgi:16S rRNA (uracil1498-N3)-methyltransferase
MTRRRWLADEVSGDRAALTGSHADHLIRVLRARVGQQFDIATGADVRQGVIESISPDRVEFRLEEAIPSAAPLSVTLLLAIFKFDRMEWAIEKCTELGVSRVVPVIASRSESHLASAAIKRVERWRKIAAQASEQSRRDAPPEIDDPIKLKDAIAQASGLRMVLSEFEREARLNDILRSRAHDETVSVALGPEGGWTDGEVTCFAESGWTAASLGSTILRAETAAIAAVAIVCSELQS